MRPIKKYCKAMCPQRFGCKRYLSTERRNEIDVQRIEVINNDPYDYKKLYCKYFIRLHDE